MRRAINDQSAAHFLTFTVVDWIDLFSRQLYRDYLIDNLKTCQEKKGLEIYSYVIMTNHAHFILRMEEGKELSKFLRDFKSFTSKGLHKLIEENETESRKWMTGMFNKHGRTNPLNKDFQVWQNGSHPTIVDTPDIFEQKQDYIHNNPVRAGIVLEPHHYFYSSACPFSPLKVLEA